MSIIYKELWQKNNRRQMKNWKLPRHLVKGDDQIKYGIHATKYITIRETILSFHDTENVV